MNTPRTHTRLATRAVAVAGCVATLLAGVTACGAENATAPAGGATQGVKAGRTSAELSAAARARHHRADALHQGHGQLAHHTQR
jgi:hypothetical protein